MKKAARRCRKLKMGGRRWSPALQEARRTILLWTLIRRRLKKCKVGARRILRLKKQLGLKKSTNLTLAQVESKLDRAFAKYKVCRNNDVELRLNHQESLAQAKAAEGNVQACKMLKAMQHREKIRSTYRRIRYATKKKHNGTTKIHIRQNQGFKEVTKKNEMEAAILVENENKFHQTESRCPLLQGQLYEDLGAMGDGPRIPDVLSGTYEPPPGTSEVTRAWLKRMQIKDPTSLKQAKTTLAQYRRGWRKVKEQTASGELHMGHFKAGAMHKKLGWAQFQMSLIPMTTGYSPARWQQGIDVMLLKAPEVYFLDKLRTIVLYESDFNHENKRLGRDAMNMALSQDMIAKEQFSRPGRSAQDNALSKRLVFDYFRLHKRPFAMCACDLKSCYDRVVHTAASLALQRVGVPISQIKCMFGTIQNLVHRIRTAFGLSKKSFGGKKSKFRRPPQGMGQGNGAGPTVWSILSSTIFEELQSRGFSTPFLYSLSTGMFQLCGFSYVDDCDLISDGNNITEVHTKLQTMLELWDELMEVNGAAIAPDKCWWYLIDFVWTGGQWKYKNGRTTHTLHVRDKDGIITDLEYLNFSKAMQMVGVYLAPDGNQRQQLQVLQTKAKTWATLIRQSPLDDAAVWTAMNQTIIKGIEYPLAATTLTEPQLESAMTSIRQTALPRSGITRKLPLSVLYGPVELQGLGVSNPYYFQYCRHIQDLVDQTWRGTPTGNLILSNLEAVKKEAGLYGYLFDNAIEVTWFNTTNSWVIETYQFCTEHNIILEEPGAIIQPQRMHDRALMEVFSKQGYPPEDLKTLNQCRLFCQVTSISDIADGLGDAIASKWMLPRDTMSQTDSSWPKQGKPTVSNWNLWTTALRESIIGAHTRIYPTLGLWTIPMEQYMNSWEWFISKKGTLVRRHNSRYTEYLLAEVRQSRRKRFHSDRSTEFIGDTTTLERTVVTQQGNYFEASGHVPCQISPSKQHGAKNWKQRIMENPQAIWTSRWLKLPHKTLECAAIMKDHQGIGVSDGSYDDDNDICSAAWILQFGDMEAKGGGIVPGPEGMSSAYRGELGGLLGQLIAIKALEDCTQCEQPYSIQIACDGKSALFKSLLTDREYFSSRNKSFDIISLIISTKESMKATIIPTHVYGHQDDLGRSLSSLEKLNVRMDRFAKEILDIALRNNEDVADALPLDPQSIIQVDYADIPVTSCLASTLRHLLSRDRLLKWWKYKNRFKAPVHTLQIDWTVLKRTGQEHSFQMSRFVSRWVSHHIGVGRMMEFRNARDINTCPRCGSNQEDTLHVIRCRAKSSRKEWKRGIRKLEKWMMKRRTDPDICRSIVQSLRRFNKEGDYNEYVHPATYPPLRSCLLAQAKIGWHGFLEGLLSIQWAQLQDNFFKSCNLRRSGTRWAIELSKQVWRLVFGMWNHRNSILFHSGKIDELNGLGKVKLAIAREHTIGLGSLDPSFAPYFRISQQSFSTMKSIALRRWFSLIRQAREEKGYLYADEFVTSLPLRTWVGLSKIQPNSSPHPQQNRRRTTHVPLHFTRTGYNE